MRRTAFITGFLAAWIVIPGIAVAFQQSQPAPESQAVAPQAPKKAGSKKIDNGNPVAKADEPGSWGLNFSGIGSSGVLPKLDFGLELLYGASPAPSVEESAAPDAGFDDMTIRGSLKRRF